MGQEEALVVPEDGELDIYGSARGPPRIPFNWDVSEQRCFTRTNNSSGINQFSVDNAW